MKEQVYKIQLSETASAPIEYMQSEFMSGVFELAHKSGIIGHGLEITREEEKNDRRKEDRR